MATIAISDLRPAGYELSSDSESFMSNLSKEELNVQGGNLAISGLVPSLPYFIDSTLNLK